MNEWKFKLGEEVEDVVTKLKGIITSRIEHITGCNTYGVVAQKISKDGTPASAYSIDEGRLVRVSRGINKKQVKAKKKGACQLPKEFKVIG